MYCKNCGKEINDAAMFCKFCGAPVEVKENDGTTVLGQQASSVSNDAGETTVLGNDVPPVYAQPTAQPEPQPVYSQPSYQAVQQQAQYQAPVQQPTYQASSVPPQYQQGAQNNQQFAPQTPNIQPNYQSNANANYQQYANSYDVNNPYANPNGAMLTYEQFYELYASNKTKSNAKTISVICFITAALSLILLFAAGDFIGIVDIIFYVIFGILIMKKPKWQLTLPVAIYGGIFSIIGLVTSGTPGGILALIISIMATVQLKKVDDAYKNYLMTNQVPPIQI